MAVPSFEDLMLPMLAITGDGDTHRSADLRTSLARNLSLNDEDLAQMLPSGAMTTFTNRAHWAKFHLDRAGLIESPARGQARITDRGRALLARNPARIDVSMLTEYPEYREFKARSQGSRGTDTPTMTDLQVEAGARETPESLMQSAFNESRSAVESEILDAVKSATPEFLERVVIDLLVALGYGGAGDSGKHLGRSGDGGVDGVIWEDKLGLDLIYVQAKRWQNTVGRPEIQAFSGSLDGFRARKGVFITTSTFTREARDYVGSIEKKIVLIDGHELARLLFDTELGVSTERTYAVKRLDSDYFAEDF
jgi:restriction system protein